MKWVDRLSLKPGRIKLTDDNGNVKYYTWERADEPTIEGTPLKADNMNNLIQIGAVLGDVPDIPVDANTLNGKSENMLDVLNAKHWDGNTPDMFVGYKDPGEQLDVANIDADTLGGHLPSYYKSFSNHEQYSWFFDFVNTGFTSITLHEMNFDADAIISISGSLQLPTNANGDRSLNITHSRYTEPIFTTQVKPAGSISTAMGFSFVCDVKAGDKITFNAGQNSGGTINGCKMTIHLFK